MRSSFKFILCLITADIIIIAMVLLLSLTGVLNVKSSNHKSVSETKLVSENKEKNTEDKSYDKNITSSAAEQTSDTNTKDTTEQISDDTSEETSDTPEETTTEFDKNTFVVINSTSTVYLRETASVSGEIICELPAGATGKIISKEDDWSKVSFEDKTGYVFNEYIVNGSTASDYINAVNTATIVIKSSCNMRDTPNTESPVTGTAPVGEKYQYIPESSNSLWFAIITDDGSIKYISTGYADVVKTDN